MRPLAEKPRCGRPILRYSDVERNQHHHPLLCNALTFMRLSPFSPLQVLISAAICTKTGKALVGRNFMEISRSRVEGLQVILSLSL
jgi:hypothetical protein